MGGFVLAEHPKGCSLRLFYRKEPCKEHGSARSAMGAIRLPLYVIVWAILLTRNTQRDVPYDCSTVPHPVRNAALPVPVGSNRFTIIFCCMGDFINTEHPKGCSLQLFYHTKPNEQENYLPPFRFNKQITDGISHEIYYL